MAFRLAGKRPVADINVTPLVDVVLVLLIIFMVLTPLSEKQMYTRVPEPDPVNPVVPPDRVPPDQVVLTLRADGRVLLNRDERSLEEALAALREAYQGRPSKVLFFNAEDAVKYDDAVRVLDLARQAGVNTIGMVTDLPPAGR